MEQAGSEIVSKIYRQKAIYVHFKRWEIQQFWNNVLLFKETNVCLKANNPFYYNEKSCNNTNKKYIKHKFSPSCCIGTS